MCTFIKEKYTVVFSIAETAHKEAEPGFNIQPTQVKHIQLTLHEHSFQLSFTDVYFHWQSSKKLFKMIWSDICV